jgi:hypothetical protein
MIPIDELIERLNDKADFLEAVHARELEGKLLRQAASALERNSKLEEALKPFAREAEYRGLTPELDRYSYLNTGLANADFRRARALLSGGGG